MPDADDIDELSLLAAAAQYLLSSILLVRGADLSAPTPCPGWDLRHLLRHLRASFADAAYVLAEREPAAGPGLDLRPADGSDPVAALRAGIADLVLCSALLPTVGRWCQIRDRHVPAGVVVYVAAVEMVLHAWDIAQACRTGRPIPTDLAATLLRVAPPLAEAGLAGHVFVQPVTAPEAATPGDQLLALFGRRPTSRKVRPG